MKAVLLAKLALVAQLAVSAVAFFPGQAGAQTPTSKTTTNDKALLIVQKGIEAVGGERYLSVKTIIGHGFFTEYKDGISGIPLKFIDYIVYPDKERTEFTGGGQHLIQTNVRETGWIFDAAARTLKDQNTVQLEDFRVAMRTSVENLLHGWWRAQGATLSYVGRREAGLARRNETVRLTYPDGFWIEYEFGAADGLPAKVIYERKQKKPDSDEMEELTEEDRLLKPVTIDGVATPYVIDHFRNGVQTSRINYESVELNKPVADSLFTKPANFKAVK
jgi:hypothetical protein